MKTSVYETTSSYVKTSAKSLGLPDGVKDAIPIVLGYIPIGFTYGVIAQEFGLTVFETTAMSLIVFAGSSQFIAIGLIAGGANYLTIILTTFVVNLRHMLMSTALLPFLKHMSGKILAFISFGITDESFAVASNRLKSSKATAQYMLGLNMTAYLSWALSSMAGAAFGSLVPNTDKLGLDFVLPAMFIALLSFQPRNLPVLVAIVVAGTTSLLTSLFVPGNWNIIIATLLGATAGMVMDR